MNILMILLDVSFPPDIRVEKETKSLIRKGYNVYLLTQKGKRSSNYETYNEVRIFRAKLSSRPCLIFQKLSRIRSSRILLKNFIATQKILEILRKVNVKIIHIHDLPFAILSAFTGRIFRKKVILDLHENWCGNVENDLRKTGLIGQLLLSSMKAAEKMSCKLSNNVIVVSPGEADRLAKLGIPPRKIRIILNAADVETLLRIKVDRFDLKRFRRKFVLSYIGGLQPHRGIDLLIKAFTIVLKKIPNALLLLVGSEESTGLREKCKNLGILNHVNFTGRVPFEEAMKYVNISNIGIIPFYRTANTENAIPHKLFQYMFFEKPVIVSDVKEMKKIVEESNCGWVFRAGDCEDLANVIMKATSNPDFLIRAGKNGKLAVLKRYNWEKESMKLIKLYSSLK